MGDLKRARFATPRSHRFRRGRVLLGLALLAVGSFAFSPSFAAPQCFGRSPTISGDSADNTLMGTPGSDVIIGKKGADTIRGRGGKDFICGNDGEDVINGGSGADKMKGARGIDYLAGGKGSDKMIGGAAGDELHGEIGKPSDNDVAKGSRGQDFINVQDGANNDTANGGPSGSDSCTTDPGDSVSSCP